MSGCKHENMTVTANAYNLADEEGEIVSRTIHLSACCAACKAALRFEGAYMPVPADAAASLAITGPWATALQHEVALKVRPFEASDTWLAAEPMGRA